MKKYLVILSIIVFSNCTTKTENTKLIALATNNTEVSLTCKKGSLEYSIFSQPDLNKDLYAVKISSLSESANLHNLIIDMRLKDGGHFVSPNATGDFSGKFTLKIDENVAFKPVSKLIETPKSVEEIDPHPFVNGPINWVRTNTTYKQQIKLNSAEPFEVKGFIQFTIEPACTLEKVPFIIKYENNDLKFEFFGC